MAAKKRIEIRFHPDGTITGETIGMKGTSCLSALELLEALIGAMVDDSEFTSEFFEEDSIGTEELIDEEATLVDAE